MSWEQLLISVLLAACYRPEHRRGWTAHAARGRFIMWAEALPGFRCVLVHNPNWRPGKAFL